MEEYKMALLMYMAWIYGNYWLTMGDIFGGDEEYRAYLCCGNGERYIDDSWDKVDCNICMMSYE